MALSPGIPTSFVPRQPIQPSGNRQTSGGTNIFLVVSFVVFGVSLILAGGVFAYDRYLAHVVETKKEALVIAQTAVNQDTVEEFVRLQNRLNTGKILLSNHIVLSEFFTVLESLTLSNLRFESLKLSVAGDHTAQVELRGMAKNFNTLAAQSNTFAGEKRIKRAIFSGITLDKGNQVNFRLTADLDSKLVLGDGSVSRTAVDSFTLPTPSATGSTSQKVPAPLATSSPVASTTPQP